MHSHEIGFSRSLYCYTIELRAYMLNVWGFELYLMYYEKFYK